MDKKIKEIADYYGYEAQSRQLIEEMAELTQAINKLWRCKGNGQSTDKNYETCMDNIAEEIADVAIMLEQIAYLLDCGDDVIIRKIEKINRQIKRIGELRG